MNAICDADVETKSGTNNGDCTHGCRAIQLRLTLSMIAVRDNLKGLEKKQTVLDENGRRLPGIILSRLTSSVPVSQEVRFTNLSLQGPTGGCQLKVLLSPYRFTMSLNGY